MTNADTRKSNANSSFRFTVNEGTEIDNEDLPVISGNFSLSLKVSNLIHYRR